LEKRETVPPVNLTERQEKWFASVRTSLERDTGRTIAEWVEIARLCPEAGHRARLRWFKDNHGLLQNRASLVLGEAFPTHMHWSEPDTLVDTLWVDATSREIYEKLDAAALALGGTVRTARKGYTAWSRKVQFAAARPVKGGKVMLGLAVSPDAAPNLEQPKSESWSERLTARSMLGTPGEVDVKIYDLLKAAWSNA
jgi:hypothetical protein